MTDKTLQIFLYGKHVGKLTGSGILITGFQYAENYAGPPLSHSLPIAKRTAERRTASNWFNNLLPEGHELRSALAAAHNTRDTTTIGLLSHAGLDCAGAVQITKHNKLPERTGTTEAITETDIAELLRAANSGQPVAKSSERWSVAGQQGKLALHQHNNGEWARAIDGYPTTHILKPGITAAGDTIITDQAYTEHLTLKAAQLLGINAAKSNYHEFNGVPAIIVERYDRIRKADSIERLHQEDFCAALGLGPEQKYEDQGGPGVAIIANLLNEISDTVEHSVQMRAVFAAMVIFNHLAGCPDAHAKNYSFLILPDGSRTLAPLYDAASGLGYSLTGDQRLRYPRNAMRIGSNDRFMWVAKNDWVKFAKELGLESDIIFAILHSLAADTPDAFRSVLDDDCPFHVKQRILKSPMLARIQQVCDKALAQ